MTIPGVCVFLLALFTVPGFGQNCGSDIDVVQKSYQRLNHKDLQRVFLYVGDVHLGWVGMKDPFEAFIIYGKKYEPFPASSGRLKADDFKRLIWDDRTSFVTQKLFVTQPQQSFTFTYQTKIYRVSLRTQYRLRKDDGTTVSVCSVK